MLEILSGSRIPRPCPKVEGFKKTDVHMFEFTENADLTPRFPRMRTKPTFPSNRWRAEVLTAMQICVIQSILIHPGLDPVGFELRAIWGVILLLKAAPPSRECERVLRSVLPLCKVWGTGRFQFQVYLIPMHSSPDRCLHCLKNCTNVCVQIVYHSKGYVSMVCVFSYTDTHRQWKRKSNSTAPVSALLCPLYR